MVWRKTDVVTFSDLRSRKWLRFGSGYIFIPIHLILGGTKMKRTRRLTALLAGLLPMGVYSAKSKSREGLSGNYEDI